MQVQVHAAQEAQAAHAQAQAHARATHSTQGVCGKMKDLGVRSGRGAAAERLRHLMSADMKESFVGEGSRSALAVPPAGGCARVLTDAYGTPLVKDKSISFAKVRANNHEHMKICNYTPSPQTVDVLGAAHVAQMRAQADQQQQQQQQQL